MRKTSKISVGLAAVVVPLTAAIVALGGTPAEVHRYVAVRTERGAVAFATGPVVGIRTVDEADSGGHPALLAGGSTRLVAGVGTAGAEPLLLLQSMRAIPDEVWEAAAAAGGPS